MRYAPCFCRSSDLRLTSASKTTSSDQRISSSVTAFDLEVYNLPTYSTRSQNITVSCAPITGGALRLLLELYKRSNELVHREAKDHRPLWLKSYKGCRISLLVWKKLWATLSICLPWFLESDVSKLHVLCVKTANEGEMTVSHHNPGNGCNIASFGTHTHKKDGAHKSGD